MFNFGELQSVFFDDFGVGRIDKSHLYSGIYSLEGFTQQLVQHSDSALEAESEAVG